MPIPPDFSIKNPIRPHFVDNLKVSTNPKLARHAKPKRLNIKIENRGNI